MHLPLIQSLKLQFFFVTLHVNPKYLRGNPINVQAGDNGEQIMLISR